MIKNGKGGGNTKTGLLFEGKTDLGTFLSNQKGYEVREINELVIVNGKQTKINVRTVFFNNTKVAELYKKHEFYSSLLKSLTLIGKNSYQNNCYQTTVSL